VIRQTPTQTPRSSQAKHKNLGHVTYEDEGWIVLPVRPSLTCSRARIYPGSTAGHLVTAALPRGVAADIENFARAEVAALPRASAATGVSHTRPSVEKLSVFQKRVSAPRYLTPGPFDPIRCTTATRLGCCQVLVQSLPPGAERRSPRLSLAASISRAKYWASRLRAAVSSPRATSRSLP
jgi:hypothetical protein